jgi:hypothetical protein
VNVPVDGGHREEVFKATFRVLDTDEAGTFDIGTPKGTTAFLRRAVIGLEDLQDEQKRPIAYSDELRERLIRIPFVRQALLNTYLDAVTKAKAGN